MYRTSRPIFILGIIGMLLPFSQSVQAGSVRRAAVAGQFYPANATQLKSDVERYLDVKTTLAVHPTMLISAHAGYIYSGPLAGRGFAEIDRETNLVILIGPSHHKWFAGISIPDVDSFETPLGKVPLAKAEIASLRKSAIVNGDFEAHAQEHCLEVQLPFLQTELPSFRIIPIVTGKVNPADVAALLIPLIGKKTLVVASSDFSHYHSSKEAQSLDHSSIEAILSGSIAGPIDACGATGIQVVMSMAPKLGLSPVLLDARNSFGTAPAGYKDSSRVVGYASIAYVKNIKAEK